MRVTTPRRAVAGALSAGVALAVVELVGALVARRQPSLVGALASRLVNLWSGSLKDFAVRTFGTHDKAALLVGIVVVCLAVGALTAMAGERAPAVPIGAFVGFGVVGLVGAWSDPQASHPALVLGALAGALAGIGALHALLRARTFVAEPSVERRRFLLGAGAAGLVTVTGSGAARWWRAAGRVATSGALPEARRVVPVPPTQPFDVAGLTPYVTAADDFYKVDTAIFVPQVDVRTWRLTIDGMVERPLSLSYDELLAMDLVDEPITLACVSNDVGGGLVGNARWLGVPLRSLLERAGVHADATQVVGRSVDDFTTGFPTAVLDDGRSALVALGMNGAPLPAAHGYPARLLVAGLYGYVSATKWLRRVELTRLEAFDAYWVQRGWGKLGPIKTEARIDVPRSGATVPAGAMTIAGVAWAPSRGISRVEVQIDDGPWVDAELGLVADQNTWVQWRYRWDAASAGAHVVAARATDGTGTRQTDVPRTPEPDGATGYPYRGFTVH